MRSLQNRILFVGLYVRLFHILMQVFFERSLSLFFFVLSLKPRALIFLRLISWGKGGGNKDCNNRLMCRVDKYFGWWEWNADYYN